MKHRLRTRVGQPKTTTSHRYCWTGLIPSLGLGSFPVLDWAHSQSWTGLIPSPPLQLLSVAARKTPRRPGENYHEMIAAVKDWERGYVGHVLWQVYLEVLGTHSARGIPWYTSHKVYITMTHPVAGVPKNATGSLISL